MPLSFVRPLFGQGQRVGRISFYRRSPAGSRANIPGKLPFVPRRFASKYAVIRQEKRRRLFLCRNNKKARKGPFSRSLAVLCVCILPVKRKLPCLCQALRAAPCGCDYLPLISSYRCRIGSKRPRAGSSGAVSLAFGTTKGRSNGLRVYSSENEHIGADGGRICRAARAVVRFQIVAPGIPAPSCLLFDCSAPQR